MQDWNPNGAGKDLHSMVKRNLLSGATRNPKNCSGAAKRHHILSAALAP